MAQSESAAAQVVTLAAQRMAPPEAVPLAARELAAAAQALAAAARELATAMRELVAPERLAAAWAEPASRESWQGR